MTTLRYQLLHPKDGVGYLDKKKVAHETPWDTCNVVYCGQTGKSASTRMHEHRLAVTSRLFFIEYWHRLDCS
nr:unnamed protein product [Spirometra erinaceieuropaei]